MSATTTPETESTSTPVLQTEVDLAKLFGAGRYSPLMREVYMQSQTVFKLNPAQAEKLARAAASDFGDAMKHVEVKATVSKKTSKDGKVTCKEAASMKGITITNALRAVQTLAWCADAGKYAVLWKDTDWKIHPKSFLGEYLAAL